MVRHACDIFRVADQVGIRLPPMRRSRIQRHPRECFARHTLRRIGRKHGEPHLALVLRLIVESRGNAAELHMDTINAVSAVVLSGLVRVDGALFERFDGLDLAELRRRAKVLSCGLPVTNAMRVLLAKALADAEDACVGVRSAA